MKNWLKNLLFVIFSFVFLGVGMLIADIFIDKKGNPLKDPNFLADAPTDSTNLPNPLTIDSTNVWTGDTVEVLHSTADVPQSEIKTKTFGGSSHDTPQNSGEYDVVIGIFGEHSNANRQVEKLKEFGYSAAYSYLKLSMNAVSAGRFSRSEAKKVASDLNNKGFDTIVKRR